MNTYKAYFAYSKVGYCETPTITINKHTGDLKTYRYDNETNHRDEIITSKKHDLFDFIEKELKLYLDEIHTQQITRVLNMRSSCKAMIDELFIDIEKEL